MGKQWSKAGNEEINKQFTAEELANEEWRAISGYEGLYEVSNLGRVKSLPRGKQWPYRRTHNNIRSFKYINRYPSVNLSKKGMAKFHFVHRLVAMAFIPNPNNYPFVNHEDESRNNNRVENLEWCTHKYNVNYGTARQRMLESKAKNPNIRAIQKHVGELNSKAVRQLSPKGDFIAEYKSMTEACEATGVNISTIIRHCKGRASKGTTRKFKFEYV